MKNLLIFAVLYLFSHTLIAQDTIVLKTEYLEKNDSVLVFTPKNYNQDSIYSLAYLLHGYGGNYKQWSKIADLQKLSDDFNIIIACPDGQYNSWYFDSPKQKKSKFESFFLNELYPFLNLNYKVDTLNIFISGLSMGGHGAFYLFLKNPELFNAAASTSGVLDLNASSLKYSSLSNSLGEYNESKEVFDSYSSKNLLKNIKFSQHPIFFDCGYSDHLYKSNLEFWEKAKELKVNAIFKQSAGRHNHNYWKKSIIWHFVFFSENIKN